MSLGVAYRGVHEGVCITLAEGKALKFVPRYFLELGWSGAGGWAENKPEDYFRLGFLQKWTLAGPCRTLKILYSTSSNLGLSLRPTASLGLTEKWYFQVLKMCVVCCSDPSSM
jgi:hypothetical protein